MQKDFQTNLKTPEKDWDEVEFIKLNFPKLEKLVIEELRNNKPDISKEVAVLAKLYGIHLQFDRTKIGTEKEWSYMLRLNNPGGGPINRKQWAVIDELSQKYSRDLDNNASIRLSTRQAIQFHWLDKIGTLDIIKTMAEIGVSSLNGSGDNLRNTTACPLSISSDIFNANKLAHKIAEYFNLPTDAFIRIFDIDSSLIYKPEKSFKYGERFWAKTKVGIAAAHLDNESNKIIMDNCVELRINEIGIAPIIDDGKIDEFQIYLGGGQGERIAAKTMACLGLPFCKVKEDKLMLVLDAIAHVHQEYGDRQNRHWARLKYLVKAKGIEWYRKKAEERLGFELEIPYESQDYGARHLHHGWTKQDNGLLAYGAFIENGRITDASPNGKLKTMVRELMDTYQVELMITPNQDILFINIPTDAKEDFEKTMEKHGYGKRNEKPYSSLRLLSGACVGLNTCPRAYTDSEQFEPTLIDELEKLGWGDLAESIGVTGCERQCFRPATKSIGLVGSGRNFYQLKLMGTDDARHQGKPIIDRKENRIYLRMIPRDKVSLVIDNLLKYYITNRLDKNESLGLFNRRIGMDGLIEFFKKNENTKDLMKMAFPATFFMEMKNT